MEVDAEIERLKSVYCSRTSVKRNEEYLLSVHDDLGGSDANLVLWHFKVFFVQLTDELPTQNALIYSILELSPSQVLEDRGRCQLAGMS